MLGGKNKNRPAGYTIVEIMIVLAISAFMFVIAAEFVNGKQEKASFTAGINDMSSSVQALIGQVNDGQYSDIPINCAFSGALTYFNSGSPINQGQNSPCVFLGKVLMLTHNSDKYSIFPIAGGRVNSAGQPITTLAQSYPANIESPINLDINELAPQSLQFVSLKSGSTVLMGSGGAPSTGFLGIFQGQGAADSQGNVLSGGQSLSMDSVTFSAGNVNIIAGTITPLSSATICLTDGTQYGEVDIGSNGSSANSLSASVKFDGTSSC